MRTNIRIYNKPIDNVTKFKYLGSWVTNDLDSEVEVRTRIERARSVFLKIKNLLTNITVTRRPILFC